MQVCDTPEKSFMLINQKGIDPMALDMLAKEVHPLTQLLDSLCSCRCCSQLLALDTQQENTSEGATSCLLA
jgi:hypothetical protein